MIISVRIHLSQQGYKSNSRPGWNLEPGKYLSRKSLAFGNNDALRFAPGWPLGLSVGPGARLLLVEVHAGPARQRAAGGLPPHLHHRAGWTLFTRKYWQFRGFLQCSIWSKWYLFSMSNVNIPSMYGRRTADFYLAWLHFFRTTFTTWLIKMTPIASVRNSGGMARSLTGPGACSRPRALSSGTTRPCLDSSPYCIRYKFVHSVKHRKDIKDATCRRLHSEATGGHHSLVQRCRRPRPALRRHIHERQHRHWVCVPLVTNDVRVIY